MDVLTELIADLSDACGSGVSPRQQAGAAARALAVSLERDNWLPASLQATVADEYTRRIVHADGAGRFTLMVMAWEPGQSTPIHDHIAWCVVGLYSGQEESVAYTLHDEPDGPVLVEGVRRRPRRGDCEILVPPEENIHKVTCVGCRPAVSLHVYGTDVRVTGSSINRTFDDMPVRQAAAATASAWRGRPNFV